MSLRDLLPIFSKSTCAIDLDGWPMNHNTGYLADTLDFSWLGMHWTLLTYNFRRGNLHE